MEEEGTPAIKPYDRNFYFFVALPEPAMDSILEYTVSKSIESAAKLYDDSYLLKLPIDAPIPPTLSKYKAHSHAEMKVEKAIREKDRPEL